MSITTYQNQSTTIAMSEQSQIRFTATTVTVNVPDDPRATLMYYFNCMCNVLNLTDVHPGVKRFRDYHHYDLNRNDIDTLIKLCEILAPHKLENKCIFECAALCVNHSCEFYNVDEIRQRVLSATVTANTSISALAGKSALFASATATSSLTIVLGGESYRITKIMTYKRSWIQENYYTPMQLLRRNSSVCIIL
ncbi:hypothetical protein CHS0354_017510 [Potamilus streckersoni]|uniref:Uncharacterized protein n=1 Tax=Potamilus streckersoni TaxID=2493646 RepID=A0AAE0VPK3_9BIVA|nr:hypothetical protein CHS0354_017510 [Potamilus streckersoni]